MVIAQVTALSQSILRLMPPGILPPYVLKYDASSVPIVQLSLGGTSLSQQQLYDLGQNFIRPQLANINGAAVPLPYGGEQRAIMVDVEPLQLAAYHLANSDVSAALNNQNLIAPSGTQKIGDREYLIGTNSSPSSLAELNNLPIRAANGSVVTMKNVAWIHNGYTTQTSFVRGKWHRIRPLNCCHKRRRFDAYNRRSSKGCLAAHQSRLAERVNDYSALRSIVDCARFH